MSQQRGPMSQQRGLMSPQRGPVSTQRGLMSHGIIFRTFRATTGKLSFAWQ